MQLPHGNPKDFPGKLSLCSCFSPGLAPAGSSRIHGIPTPCSQDGTGSLDPNSTGIPREFGTPRKSWWPKMLGILGARHKEDNGKKEFHRILWLWEQPRDGFFPLPVWLLQRFQHWDPLGISAGSSPAQEFQENRDFHGMSWFGWFKSHPILWQPQSLDIPRDSSGSSSPFQAGIFPYFPSSQAPQASKA